MFFYFYLSEWKCLGSNCLFPQMWADVGGTTLSLHSLFFTTHFFITINYYFLTLHGRLCLYYVCLNLSEPK